ncbi:carbohydrate binding family 9 domain-containing protein [bacterium]|nr:carbohydrate binding family 9 domain-containing protein [FCB group bacterium]MBL7190237.1 carbohydrate binding family 9 domain-containing protein [bacterium]
MLITGLLICQFFIQNPPALANDKNLEAARINAPIRIDGILDEPVWVSADWAGDFLQYEPNRLGEPSEETVFAVVYDDEAVYFAVKCYDSSPELIEKKVRRRDSMDATDCIYIVIDSRHDKSTAFCFALSAGGTMCDYYFYNDDQFDDSWDSVWEGRTSVDQSGWNAEFKIPYTSLRFAPAAEYTWGLNISREIARKKEEVRWVVYSRETAGEVSLFGAINGIKDIPQPFNLEILPYAKTKYSSTADETGFDSGAGLDLKYSLNSGFIIDAAVNPDFGQVEADPAILNLGVYETFYPEKRPFFLEGASLFDTPFMLFYSRRIGKSPGYYDISDDAEIVSEPDNTTILGAVKLTGKNAKGLSVGLIEAVTGREYAEVEHEGGGRDNELIEPCANYFAARVLKDIWEGNSSIGGMATAMNREAGMSAYTGGLDWNLNLWDNDYKFRGQAVISERGDNQKERDSGYGVTMDFERQEAEHHFFEIGFTAKSPDFYINDLGYTSRNDIIELEPDYWFRHKEPCGIFRQIWFGLGPWISWNYDGVQLSKGGGFWVNLQYRNYWWTNFGAHYNFECYSDLETRGGPLIKPPENWGFWYWGSTDQSKKVYGTINFWGGKNASNSWWEGVYTGLVFRPMDRLETSVSACYERMFDENQWVDNIDDDNASTHYVFGRLLQKSVNLTLRGSYNFSRDMSLQLYAQPFNAVGDYKEYVELAEPGTYTFKPYNLEDDYDFNWKNLNFNAVFRWEYAPGSTIYLVWSRGMSEYAEGGQYVDFDFAGNFYDLACLKPDDIFLIKVNKWFDF